MKPDISFGGITASYGAKAQGYFKVLDTGYAMPVTVINGAKEGKTILITSGIHGGEYLCIQTAIELAENIDPSAVSGQIVIIHPVNLQAFYARISYFVPEDSKNINRMFPGKKDGTLSEKIAYVISTEFQAKADYYFDLHGGDLHEALPPYVCYPGIGDRAVQFASKNIAEILSMNYIVKSESPSRAFVSAALQGIPSLMIEMGGCGLWSVQEVEKYKGKIINIIKYLKVMSGKHDEPKSRAIELSSTKTSISHCDGCWYPLVKLGDVINKGQKIGEIKDVFGKKLEDIYAECNGIVIFLVVSLAISKGDPLLSYGVK